MAFDAGLLWLGIEPDSKPNAYQARTLMSGEEVVVAEFEVYEATGRLLGYGGIASDAAVDHDAVQEWIADQAEHLISLTAQRQP